MCALKRERIEQKPNPLFVFSSKTDQGGLTSGQASTTL